MPYIRKDQRQFSDPETPGELNFLITSIVLAYLVEYAGAEGRLRYDAFNGAMGALECSKQEIYRRVGSWLEDAAILRNGDLPEFESLLK